MTQTVEHPFLSDVETLRERAKKNIERGAVVEGYQANRLKVIELLNTALATEIVCTLRYRRHHFVAAGLHAESVAAEFLEHSGQELEHADRLAERIVQLGGEPKLDPSGLTERSHSEFGDTTSLREMLRENLVAERIAVESYTELIRYIGDGDPTTRRMIEDILAVEERHADELAGLMDQSAD